MTAVALRGLRHVKHAIGEAIRDIVSTLRVATRRATSATASRPTARPRILLVDEMLPEPSFGAGYPRAAEMLQAVVDAGWDATVYPMIAGVDDYAAVRARFPTGVTFVRTRGEPGLRRLIHESVGAFDTVVVSRSPVMATFARIVAKRSAFVDRTDVIYDVESTFTAREARRRALFGAPLSDDEYGAALDAEIGLAGTARAVITVTEADARLFRARTTATVHVVGHASPVRSDPPGFEGRADLLFVGRSVGAREDSPNVDSLIWFVEEVMPHLDPAHRLVIAGLADDALVGRLASSRVAFAGVVADLRPLYDRCRVFVAPTRFAAGLPLKVVEAAAAGIPCVMTDLLAEQLDLRDGIECMASGDAAGFADRCTALATDRDRWTGVRDAALSRIAATYSREAFGAAVRRVLDDSIASHASSSNQSAHRTRAATKPFSP